MSEEILIAGGLPSLQGMFAFGEAETRPVFSLKESQEKRAWVSRIPRKIQTIGEGIERLRIIAHSTRKTGGLLRCAH